MLIFVIFIVGEYSRFYSVVLSLSRKISTVGTTVPEIQWGTSILDNDWVGEIAFRY